MKIGIVTFHFAHNYGALLQCYALKMFLQQKGFDVSVIDYAPDYHRSVYPVTNSVFEKFICENIMPKPYGIDDKYDIIIYGSDTVWHPFDFSTFKGFDTAYFGKVFESGKNIAFSASANMKAYRQKDLLDLPALLQNFDAIAVRESLLKDFLQPYYSNPIHHTCDPTLLLDTQTWSSLCAQSLQLDKPYVFVYNQQFASSTMYDIIDTFMRNNGSLLPVYLIDLHGNSYLRESCGRIIKKNISPFDFVSLIKNAEYVFVSSFHGCSFSAIFAKQFNVMYKHSGERIDSFLNKIGLHERLVTHSNFINFNNNIEWDKPAFLLQQHINDSKKWLLNQLEVQS